MKPPNKLRKIEEFRVEPRRASHGAPHGGESWAVSYADMLMVLLSFFVMFFSLKEESPDNFEDQLTTIAMSMKDLPSQSEAAAASKSRNNGKQSGTKSEHEPASISEMKAAGTLAAQASASAPGETNTKDAAAAGLHPDAKTSITLAEALKIEGVTVIDEKTQLVVTLDEGVFGTAEYNPKGLLLAEVDQIVERLKPFATQIQIQIIGHTDARKLRPRNEYLQDNFDLSSMRALRVLKHVVAKGFPENRASARAASSYDRDARSVTFVIQPHGQQKTEKGS